MKKPENKYDVMRLLGLFKCLGKFIPNLSQKTAALRFWTHNNVKFCWTWDHETESKNLLKIIASNPIVSL